MNKILLLIAVMVAGYFTWNANYASDEPHKLIVSGPFEFHGIDLSKDGSVFSRLGVTQSLTGLKPDGSIEPVLAESWSQNSDGTVWVFKIRDHVKFHNGAELTAKDVAASLIHAGTKPGIIKNIPIKAINSDGMTLTIVLKSPYRPLLNTLAHFTLGIISADSFDIKGNIKSLNGTGPFSIAELVAPHKLTLNKFKQYWGKIASVDVVEYQAGHRSESRALQVQSGQADIAYSIDAISKQSVSGNAATVESINLPRTILVKINNTHPYLADVRVRQAISLAIDRTGIVNTVLFSPDSEAYQLFSTNYSAWHLADLKGDQDLKQAKNLLAELGWKLNSAGVLEKNGETFNVNLITYADRPELPMIATALQNQLSKIGIAVNVSIENSSAIPAGHHDDSLNLAIIARNFGMAGTPLPLLYSDFSRPEGSDWGHMNWSNDQLSTNLEQLVSTSEIDSQHVLEQKSAKILVDNLPVIPIAYSSQHVAVNNKLSGLTLDPFELNYRLEDLKFND